ncbi:universal stress protein [Halobacteriales archaeon QH_6_64_20]|nr:MAG: universal stress protein [Halobacteriales archaeon QH_6_64_20]
MYDRILIPTNGSAPAEKGANHAIELAAALGATVHALYVADLPGVPRALALRDDEEEVRERYREHGREVTGDVRDVAADAGIECVTAMKSGSVHEEIADYAEDENIDVIVIGTAYRGKVGALFGGEAEKVVRTSTVPVTTVRMRDDE